MFDKEKDAIYVYGIQEFIAYENNPKILVMIYGNGKQFHFHKSKAFDLFRCLISDEEFKLWNLNHIKNALNDENNKIVKVLNSLLAGRAVTFVTDFKSINEYVNVEQNGIKYLTNFDMNGKLFEDSENKRYVDDVTFEELYPEESKHIC